MSLTPAEVSSDKGMRQLARDAIARGWRIERTGGGHCKWVAPNGQAIFTPFSPGDHRGVLNFKSRMKRADPGLFA